MKLKYLALLRGVNVSGKNLIKMIDLKAVLLKQNFQDVDTYIQSGNLIFSSEIQDRSKIEEIIQSCIFEQFKLTVPVIVLTSYELNQIITKHPFQSDPNSAPSLYYITFFNQAVDYLNLKKLENRLSEGESIFLTPNCLYLHCPNGYGNTKLSNHWIENKLGVVATSRNWNTCLTLLNKINKILDN
jgi:uncharacterized protein (DUF1697 family)